ncbi:hypothetical protein ACLB2K_052196 [Fragaria x ananassa]
MWGLDLIGPFPVAKSQFRYIIVGIDDTTKWIEAVPLVKINTHRVEKFIWNNICCRFRVPNTNITDNGAQFNNQELISWAAEKELQIKFASVAHPQTNGQVEAANKKIKALLKKKLDEAKGLWAEKLPEVLWAIRTTPTRATGETPFFLTYGTEAVLPVELMHPTARVEVFDPATNDEGLLLDNDLLEEKRVKAQLTNLQNKQKEARFYNKRVRRRSFLVGDWVMNEVIPAPKRLNLTWEGPYQIVEAVSPGTYYIKDKSGKVSAHPWNTQHLRRYYADK